MEISISQHKNGNFHKFVQNIQKERVLFMQNKHIAKMIRKLCKEKGITIKTLSEVCGLSTSFMFDLEKKDASPSVKTLTKIADYFNCSLDYLAGRSDKE